MIAYIALGSNLGDRAATFDAALRELDATPGIRVIRISTFHDTDPIDCPPDSPRFLNAAAAIETTLEPAALMAVLQEVERHFHRERSERNAPRTLDLDLILYGDLERPKPDPVVPHPRMVDRRFVLEPLAEIAAEVVVPGLEKTVTELLNELKKEPVSPRGERSEPSASADAETLGSQSLAARRNGNSSSLKGLRTLVTGSTSGIGHAIARSFAVAGADVIVHGRQPGNTIARELTTLGVRSQALHADLRDSTACHKLAADARDVWGGLDICVLNAGADVLTGPAAGWSFERKLAELLAVDVTATMLLGRDLGERMKSAGGAIVTIGWDQAETGMEGDSGQLFAAAKGAVMSFTKGLAVSLAPHVRVNCVAPGWVRTAWGESAPAAWQERAKREAPLGRWGTADDVAAAVVWLASPAAAFVTGQVLRVNGGAVR